MKAVDSHLLTLLKASSQFIVPIYQRLYSWQEAECSQLWADIKRAGSTPALGSHFTGSIVYVAKDQSTNTSAEPDLIIDGQQRLTTVTLILAALAARLEALPKDQQEPWDGFSPRKIRNRQLVSMASPARKDDQRKFSAERAWTCPTPVESVRVSGGEAVEQAQLSGDYRDHPRVGPRGRRNRGRSIRACDGSTGDNCCHALCSERILRSRRLSPSA